VNTAGTSSDVTLTPKNNRTLQIWESDLLEANKSTLPATFPVPAKGIIMIRVVTK
jgi:alpha-mannosidase